MEQLLTKSYDLELNEHLKEFDDATTEIAEMLEGSMRTPVEFYFDGLELRGRDGRKLSEVTQNAIDDAARIVGYNPNLMFEYRRRLIERDEVEEVNAMAADPLLPNTMVVVSDFPPELYGSVSDVGGYNISRKQAYLRVYSRQSDGHVMMFSQSLDHSNRKAMEQIYSIFGISAQPGELLGQRIHTNITEDEQNYVIDRLTGAYDRSMTEQFGGIWYAGRQDWQRRNTYDFVCGQLDLVLAYIKAQKNKDPESLYDIAAAMQARFDNKQVSADFKPMEFEASVDVRLHLEIMSAGRQARSEGRSFSACGVTLSAKGQESSTEENLQNAGLGNNTDSETKYSFDKKMYCVVCQAPPKKDETKKMCGPCGICKACDTKLKKKV